MIGFTLNNDDYIYIKNLQVDIIAITDTEGITLVKYIYDAYCNFVVDVSEGYSCLAEANPYTYRGYRYDWEIGMYFLNSA
ncbi:MAG: hypothetical protein WCR28_01955 [Candidatus Izemoplasmatales bacterium]|nr:hypothetical protein [Candidatus Izemoplasmatales bacterium]